MEQAYSQVLMSLIAMLGLLLIGFYLLKKLRFSHFHQHQYFKIVHVSHLSPKEKILLLCVHDTELLIGVTHNHIATLHVFPRKPEHNPAHATYQDIANLTAAKYPTS